jgi:hypothetical protein
VEYKIFGPNGTPTEEFRTQLRSLLALDEIQRKTIAQIFLRGDFDPFRRTVPPAVAASSLLPEQFTEAADLIGFLLASWREHDLDLGDIERDLLLLGCTQSEIVAMVELLKSLSQIREGVWAKRYTWVQQADGLPTMDNVNIICDARAVFGGFPEGAEQVRESYKTLLGLTPIVILEIISSDNYGRRERSAFQMNDEQFEWFRKAMNRAHEQLTILKERIKATIPVV